MQTTIPVQSDGENRVQRVSNRCLECGDPVARPSRGPTSRFCPNCRPRVRTRSQLRAYLVSAQRLARAQGLEEVAQALAPVLVIAKGGR